MSHFFWEGLTLATIIFGALRLIAFRHWRSGSHEQPLLRYWLRVLLRYAWLVVVGIGLDRLAVAKLARNSYRTPLPNGKLR